MTFNATFCVKIARRTKSILDFSTNKQYPSWGKVPRGRLAPGLGKGRFGVSWIIERINEIYPALSLTGAPSEMIILPHASLLKKPLHRRSQSNLQKRESSRNKYIRSKEIFETQVNSTISAQNRP